MMFKYRICFSKERNLKYLSHLDVIKTIERAVRRAELIMVYSEGFHPHPKLSFGPALAVGISSMDEYLDIELVKDYEPEFIKNQLNHSLPDGLTILAVRKFQLHHNPKPLNAVINRASYNIGIKVSTDVIDQVADDLKKLLSYDELPVTRISKDGQKIVNIRPWLHNLSTEKVNEDTILIYLIGEIGSGGHLKPEDIIGLIPLPVEVLYITRLGLWHEEMGQVIKPMDFCDKIGGI